MLEASGNVSTFHRPSHRGNRCELHLLWRNHPFCAQHSTLLWTFDPPYSARGTYRRQTWTSASQRQERSCSWRHAGHRARDPQETLAGEGANTAICARNADQVSETIAALKDTVVACARRALPSISPIVPRLPPGFSKREANSAASIFLCRTRARWQSAMIPALGLRTSSLTFWARSMPSKPRVLSWKKRPKHTAMRASL